MADRPQTIKEWATSSTAEIAEPSENFKKLGFGITQPSVRFFNWVLNNIYQWISYFEDGIASEGGFNHTHKTARPRIQLPFSFREENKLSQIEVFKKETKTLSGVGNSNTGNANITGGREEEGSLTYVAGNSNAVSGAIYSGVYEYGMVNFSGKYYRKDYRDDGHIIRIRSNDFNLEAVDLNGLLFKRQGVSAGFYIPYLVFNIDGMITYFDISVINEDGTFPNFDNQEDYGFDELVEDNDIFLIGYNSRIGVATNQVVIWRIDNSNPGVDDWTDTGGPGGLFRGSVSGNLRPEFININMDTMDAVLVAKSYTERKRGFVGSSSGQATISDVAWNLESYQYDIENRKVKIEITPTQTNKSLFHTFKIRQGGVDMLSLNSSDAEFASGQWAWNVPSDPITETGTYEFVFQTGGADISVHAFTKVRSGLSLDTYDGVDYLHVSSGVSNNQQLFIRKI